MRRVARGIAAGAGVLACTACGLHNAQNALDVAGPHSGRIAGLWWMMLPIGAVVWVLVVSVMLVGASRRPTRARGPRDELARLGADEAQDRRFTRAIGVAVAATVVTLFIVLVRDFQVGQALTMPPATQAVPIKVVGHQYWWEVWYPDSTPQKTVITANELHIPVGKAVVMELTARDVIHSIWVPSLAGKKDLLPGYTRSLWLRADTAGVYRGQCAEFCGLEHAKMGMLVIAEPQDKYDAWIKAQQSPGAEPTDSTAAHGKTVFMGTTCAMCHAIGGTSAGALTGPDLTHIGSRRTIAAGTLANTDGNLMAWITDPQRIKPGVLM
ncbi:MAG: cytochrome c oxidase, subunit, partial [Gemmatimonadetes bacterium]|nr:cytochrome c oxidase, subunit [Gemmatimonadota bacterium]